MTKYSYNSKTFQKTATHQTKVGHTRKIDKLKINLKTNI